MLFLLLQSVQKISVEIFVLTRVMFMATILTVAQLSENRNKLLKS